VFYVVSRVLLRVLGVVFVVANVFCVVGVLLGCFVVAMVFFVIISVARVFLWLLRCSVLLGNF